MFAAADFLAFQYQRLLDLIYPCVCAQCGASSAQRHPVGNPFFCYSCWNAVRRVTGSCCPVCAIPYVSDAALTDSLFHRCGECREDAPYFSRAISPYLYEGTVAKAIHLFKYGGKNALAAPLSELFFNDLVSLTVDRVMAIPLHPKKLRSRGFNQSLLLAHRISRYLGHPLLIDALCRVRETPPQVGLSRKGRKENLKGAFKVAYPHLIQGRRILLVDDVYTTGATLREGAKALIKAGAEEVVVAALARMI